MNQQLSDWEPERHALFIQETVCGKTCRSAGTSDLLIGPNVFFQGPFLVLFMFLARVAWNLAKDQRNLPPIWKSINASSLGPPLALCSISAAGI